MEKAILERFVAKYNLGGAAESVLWSTDNGGLKTRFISDDKNVLGVVETTEATFEEGEYSIYDTANLRGLMSVLDEDIQIKVNKRGDKITSLGLRDQSTKVTYVLAKPEVIPDVPGLKNLPNYEADGAVILKLDERFLTTFVKGKNALPDVETFTVITEDGITKIILGYSSKTNTNRVAFNVDLESGDVLDRPVQFSARYMKEILLSNKEARGGLLRVSPAGLAHCTFDLDGFAVDYYLVEIKTK